MSYQTLKEKTAAFLSEKTIAVIGVSTTNKHEAANGNFKALKERGYAVIPVNPKGDEFEGVKFCHEVNDLPGEVHSALIFTHPSVTEKVARECYEKGIANIWVHRSFGVGSHSGGAAEYFKDKNDVNFIDGACPMMFIQNADWFHKSLRTIMKWTGKLPN